MNAMVATQQGSSKIAVLKEASTAKARTAPVPSGALTRTGQSATVGVRTSQPEDRDSYSVTALADITDRSLHAAIARFTSGISPAALAEAYLDWATHLTYAPGKRTAAHGQGYPQGGPLRKLRGSVSRPRAERRNAASNRCRRIGDSSAKIGRNGHLTSSTRPFCCSSNGGTMPPPACAASRNDMRRWLSLRHARSSTWFAPSNFPLTNPEILRHTISTGGRNLVSGWQNLLEDWERAISGKKPIGTENFVVGRDVAITPGKIVYRNRLIELIQYAPATASGTTGTDPHRSRLDHEILHPRSVAGKLAGQVSHRAGLHGLHDLLE